MWCTLTYNELLRSIEQQLTIEKDYHSKTVLSRTATTERARGRGSVRTVPQTQTLGKMQAYIYIVCLYCM